MHRRTTKVHLAFLLAMACCSGIVPHKASAAENGGPLILHLGASGGDLPLMVRLEVADRLGLTDEEMTRAQPFVDYVFHGALLWPTDTAADLCATGTAPVDLALRVAQAEAALETLAYDDAVGLLSVIPDGLACLAEPADGPALGRGGFLLGYARFQSGDRDGAAAAFSMAAQFDPDVEWDNTYPPEVQQSFNNAVLAALRTPPASVAFSDEYWKRSKEVLVDGQPLPEGGATRPGLHRVTLPSRAPGGVAAAVDFGEGQAVHLWPVEDLITGLMAGDELGEPALDALVAALQRQGAADAYVVEPASRRLFRFHVETRQLKELPKLRSQPGVSDRPVVQKTPLHKLPEPTPGATLIIAGAASAVVGLSLGIGLRTEAMEIYNAVVRDPDQKGRMRDDFERAEAGMTVGFIVAGIGGAAVGVGIPVSVLAAKDKLPGNGSATLHLSYGERADGTSRATILLSGRW